MSTLVAAVRARLAARKTTWWETRQHECQTFLCAHPSHGEAQRAYRDMELHAESDLAALCDRVEALEAALDLWCRFVVTTASADCDFALNATMIALGEKTS